MFMDVIFKYSPVIPKFGDYLTTGDPTLLIMKTGIA